MKRIPWVSSFCFLFVFSFLIAASDETVVTAEVDRAVVNVGDPIVYKLTVNTTARNIPSPELPDFKGLNVVSAAQSSTIAFGDGKLRSALVYTRILVAAQAGKIKIAPSKIRIGKDTVSSNEIEIEVREAKIKPAPAAPQESPETIEVPAEGEQTIL